MTRAFAPTLALALLPLLAACSTTPAQADRLTGTTWRLATIDGTAPRSDRARLEFRPGRISATVGCNGLGGEWRSKGSRLVTGRFLSTMMYCDGLMEQERALAQLLESGPAYTLVGGQLTLTGGGHTARFTRAQ